MSHSPFPWSQHPQVPTNVYDADGMNVSASLGPNAEDNAALIAAIPAMIQALQDIVNPLGALKRCAVEQGRQIEGRAAIAIANDPEHLRGIARAVLTSIGKKP